jgi:hypothetical protein
MGYTTAQIKDGVNNMNVYAQRAKLGDLVYAASAGGYPLDYPGKIFFVNNITGSSSGDGLTWGTAFSTIALAIAAVVAFQAAQTTASLDIDAKCIIYVAGTATAYAALTSLPSYCDIIGVGADPRGNGTGIARVTAATGTDTVDDSVGVRGLNIYNMQFTGSGTGYAMDLAICYRSVFENCAFVNKSDGALRILQGGAITIRNCQFGGDTVLPAVALTVGNSGGNFNQALVEDSVFYGTTTGIANSAYLCDSTVFRKNTIYGGTTGILDTSTESNIAGNAFYVGNFVSAGSDAINVSQNPTLRVMGNFVSNNGTNRIETSVTDITT